MGRVKFFGNLLILDRLYLLKESLERLWTYTYEGAAARYLNPLVSKLAGNRLGLN